MKGLIGVEGRRGHEKDVEHTAAAMKELKRDGSPGQSWEMKLFVEYTDVFDHTVVGKS